MLIESKDTAIPVKVRHLRVQPCPAEQDYNSHALLYIFSLSPVLLNKLHILFSCSLLTIAARLAWRQWHGTKECVQIL